MNVAIVALGHQWISVARLPAALKKAGFSVYACCPRNSFLMATRFVDGVVAFDYPFSAEGLYAALDLLRERWGIDVVLPGDEGAVEVLHGFVRGLRIPPGRRNEHLSEILNRSLGDERWHDRIERRSSLAALGESVPGLLLPRQRVCTPDDNVFAIAEEIGYPVLLKRDYTSAGLGVAGVRSAVELARFVDSQKDFVRRSVTDARLVAPLGVVVQKWIDGSAAATSLSAVDGRIMASFNYRRLCTKTEPFGPTSVAEVIDHRAMTAAAAALVERFGFTGIGGVDFVIDADGRPYALEINARPTLTSHLGPIMGGDLCAGFLAGLSGAPAPTVQPPEHRRIALFPLEWERDATSPYLQRAFHDVPWEDPRLLRALLAPPAPTASKPLT